jgi:hypothetical protein
MQDDARRKLENQLMVMGLNRLDDPALIPVLANIINSYPGFSNPHAFYLGLLNECDQQNRYEMYEALKPHLKFKVWPLDKYIQMLKEHASHVETHGHPYKVRDDAEVSKEPIKFGGKEFEQVSAADSDGCILGLTCYKCTRTEEFWGVTAVEAAMVARSVGWVRDLEKQKEICPDCPAVRLDEPRTNRPVSVMQ